MNRTVTANVENSIESRLHAPNLENKGPYLEIKKAPNLETTGPNLDSTEFSRLAVTELYDTRIFHVY
jgi:hypothetical protein